MKVVAQWRLFLVVVLVAHCLPLQAVESQSTLALVSVVERQFLYNFGLSLPGTLGVDAVQYRVEVLGHWRNQSSLDVGQRLAFESSGGCAKLLQPNHRYLIPVVTAVRLSQTGEQLEVFHFECDAAIDERDAADTIAKLNAEESAQASL